MKRSLYILTAAIVVLFSQHAFCGTYGGGSGTSGDPYVIATAEQMQEIGANVPDWDKHFVLTSDIDMSAYTGMSYNIIGNSSTAFTGVFDGAGYEVKNLNINTSGGDNDNLGLFGILGTYSDSNGAIRNLGVVNVKIIGGRDSYAVGGLVGRCYGTISNSYATGVIRGGGAVGGLIGRIYEALASNCYAKCKVSGQKDVGGFVGYAYNSNIEDCYATGDVFGYAPRSVYVNESNTGGLAGFAKGLIIGCNATGDVYGYEKVGGLIGYFYGGDVIKCSSLGDVYGYDEVGGLMGYNRGSITDCCALGNIDGYDAVGGLLGSHRMDPIINCYAVGSVSGTYDLGGLIGESDLGEYSSTFWNSEVNPNLSGIGDAGNKAGVLGKTTLELQTKITFTDHGWDFVGESSNGDEDVWYMPVCGFPLLTCRPVGIVPDVTGLQKLEAVDLVNSSGLIAADKTTYSKVVPKGYIISQDPSAGCESSFVVIRVSEGPAYDAGSGTESDPYQISTAEQMLTIGTCPADWDKHFVLMADIDMAAYPVASNCLIGDAINDFTGVFDGNGHVISNFACLAEGISENIGLFRCIGIGGQVSGLSLTDVIIEAGNSSYAGGLAGVNYGTITDCFIIGSINGLSCTGGLTGENRGIISDCFIGGEVDGRNAIGGISGRNLGEISNCYALGMVKGDTFIGGLVGENLEGSLKYSYAAGDVIGGGSIGGVAGINSQGTIMRCYSTVNIHGASYVGGLVGSNFSANIQYCYAVGRISDAYYNVGGLIGQENGGTYTSNFWDRDINPSLTGVGNIEDLAGILSKTTTKLQTQTPYLNNGWDFVGEDVNGTNDIWYMPASGYPLLSWQSVQPVPEVMGLSETDAVSAIDAAGSRVLVNKVHSETVESGFVVTQEPVAGIESNVVTIMVSDGFPYGSGNGSEADPYRIWTAEQMNAIGEDPQDWDKHFVLMADIDLSAFTGTSYNVIGRRVNGFKGVFDGNGHTVSNLHYSSSGKNYIGIFGHLATDAHVMDVKLANIVIEGTDGNYIGCLTGGNEGLIERCSSTGSVAGNSAIGGLVGCNGIAGLVNIHPLTSLRQCYTNCTLSGNYQVGGLAGISYESSIENCGTSGSVFGSAYAGGMVGKNNYGTMMNCFSAVSVSGDSYSGGFAGYDSTGSYISCFWDKDVNPSLEGVGIGNIVDPAGVMGRRTAKLQRQIVFTDYGWDFVGESINGSDDVWQLCVDGLSYPRLRWEFDGVGDFECPDGVGGEDLAYFVEHWLTVDERADLDGDGGVDLVDFVIFAEHWMEGV